MVCPSAFGTKNRFFSNYVAIIGPGTIWRKEGPVSIKDLADPSVTVMAIECANSGKHWAEPYTLHRRGSSGTDENRQGDENFHGASTPSMYCSPMAASSLRADMPISVGANC